jgi:hypothetical protein
VKRVKRVERVERAAREALPKQPVMMTTMINSRVRPYVVEKKGTRNYRRNMLLD